MSTRCQSRIDANFARAAITAGASVAPALTFHGWENKLQGCTDMRNETPVTARTFANEATFGGAGASSYSALWYGSSLPGPGGGLPGFPVIDPAGPGTLAARRTTCRSHRASTR